MSWFSTGGWFLGHTVGTGNGNVAVREAQYRAAFSEGRSLAFARRLVAAKIKNSRTMLRRNWRSERGLEGKQDALAGLKRLASRVLHPKDIPQLLGQEGEAAAIYFGGFDNMLATSAADGLGEFSFTTRNRRPPTDPVNAMLSLAYALLVRTFSNTISSTGLDPYLGLYHRPRHNRPPLALRASRRAPAGMIATPNLNSASPIAVKKRLPPGRPATQATTAGFGVGRISSETTLVSRTNIRIATQSNAGGSRIGARGVISSSTPP